ncbi:alpha-hydroxy acid oxidase [Salinicola rhizosphaerae]|uniref:FMN-dependent dehydrogenase n=1 Tax=Salinicola rhizosphaerae TaxID=1443141 RepID=A0ABQ3DX24_9GAMM|nr:alpha-hydroxy acid oxidase [Salinicola rhizosphaerae]GHB18335.1 FMN-dependent dehydrogenase [Salinicola rhizosphaerae]
MRRRYPSHYLWRRAKSIDELAIMARHRLPAFAWEYLDGGAEDEVTLANNRRAFGGWQWQPRTLRNIETLETRTSLLDEPVALPLAIAPTGYNGMLWKDGDIALARAASHLGVPFTLSTVSCNSLEQIAAAVPEARLWLQLYVLHDETTRNDMLERALAANADALLVTTDAVVLGRREWDSRCFARPRRLGLKYLFDAALHPLWARQALWPQGLPTLGNLTHYLPEGQHSAASAASYIGQQMTRCLTWETLAEIRRRWPRKLLVKGILNAEDALEARRIGADGVVVTNHGGRQLDGAPASLDALSEVVDAVGDSMHVLLDSGIRRGSDIAKAVALGAEGVLSGRATLYGLALGGEAGAGHALTLMHEQLTNVMAQLGCGRVDQLDPGYLRRSLYPSGLTP